MRKLAFVLVSVALAFGTGCATKEFVKSQVDPQSERIGRVESRLDAIDAKLDQQSKDAGADRAGIEEAKGMAQKAMDSAKKAEEEAARAAENAAKAQAAADRAEQAAAKTEKMFRLQQKK